MNDSKSMAAERQAGIIKASAYSFNYKNVQNIIIYN